MPVTAEFIELVPWAKWDMSYREVVGAKISDGRSHLILGGLIYALPLARTLGPRKLFLVLGGKK